MHMNLKTLTAIMLMLSAATLAGPALAQSSPPGKGTGAEASRDAPATLPVAKAKPLPKVSSDGSARALGEEPSVESYGTVTLNRDGSVTESEASDSMRAILGAEAAAPGGGTPASLTVGPDDRKQITDSSSYPYSAVGWLFAQDQKDGWSTCSATLIGPKTVITAAHCVYDHGTGGWVKQLLFIPGATDAESAPFGAFDWDGVHVLKGYIENYDGENYGSAMPWDMAIINLIESPGDTLGWMGFMVDKAGAWKAGNIGYPADKPDGTMWESSCKIVAENYADLYGAEGLLFWHTCDTYSGSSGSSIFEVGEDGLPYVRGINVAEDDQRNYATDINDVNFDWIQSYYQ